MNTKAYLSVLVLVVTISALSAKAKEVQSKGFQQGTVVSVERQEVMTPNQCCYSGSDAPLQTSVLRIRCFCKGGMRNLRRPLRVLHRLSAFSF